MGFTQEQPAAWSEVRELWEASNFFGQKPETANGPGATLESTERLRAWLPEVIADYDIGLMLDAACGDWNWMCHTELSRVNWYIGWDCEPKGLAVARENADTHRHNGPDHTLFQVVNLVNMDGVPEVDLILCRHFLQHLPTNAVVAEVIDRFRQSGSALLLVTTFPGADNAFEWDPDGYAHAWKGYFERPVDLEAAPFNLGPKLTAFPETQGPGGVIAAPHELALFRL